MGGHTLSSGGRGASRAELTQHVPWGGPTASNGNQLRAGERAWMKCRAGRGLTSVMAFFAFSSAFLASLLASSTSLWSCVRSVSSFFLVWMRLVFCGGRSRVTTRHVQGQDPARLPPLTWVCRSWTRAHWHPGAPALRSSCSSPSAPGWPAAPPPRPAAGWLCAPRSPAAPSGLLALESIIRWS